MLHETLPEYHIGMCHLIVLFILAHRKKRVATMSTMVKKAARNTPIADLPG
jgi:hypothetical protein